MTYEAACDYLFNLRRFDVLGPSAFTPSLEPMYALMAEMGDPHQAFPSLHVAGTNGKGSTCAFLASCCQALGLKTGLHTSPHLFDFTERMRINGQPADPDWITEAVLRFRSVFDRVRPSFFEASTALSFLYFAEQHVDIAVIEVGMGGRLDATNVITPRAALITNIGWDHMASLGTTLPAIAKEKAGIIKPHVPVLTTADQPEVCAVFQDNTTVCDAPLHRVRDEIILHDQTLHKQTISISFETPLARYDKVTLGLAGAHQVWNAALAVRTVEVVFPDIASTDRAVAVRKGLAHVQEQTGLRARAEILHTDPLIMADVAHNPEGLQTALTHLEHVHAGAGTIYVLMGLMRDKAVTDMARILKEHNVMAWPFAAPSPRALPLPDWRVVLEKAQVPIAPWPVSADPIRQFLHQAQPDDALLITGSHFVVGAVLQAHEL